MGLLVVDGGLSTELIRLGFPVDSDDLLWTSRYLLKDYSALRKAHLSFLEHGADVILTGTYQASSELFEKEARLGADEFSQVIHTACDIARQAVNEFLEKQSQSGRRKPLIAGSVGPYGACLHDFSEYHGNYVDSMTRETIRTELGLIVMDFVHTKRKPSRAWVPHSYNITFTHLLLNIGAIIKYLGGSGQVEDLVEWHRPRIKALVDAKVDLLALETIPSIKEAESLLALLQEFPSMKAWMTFYCKDTSHIGHGETFAEAVSMASACPQIIGVGTNCVPAENITALLQGASTSRNGKPFVVYPNAPGEQWIDDSVCGKTKGSEIEDLIPSWIEAGATYIGGCCGTSALDIKHIASLLTDR